MHDKPKESDWKTFRAIVPELRERYLKARNLELMAILQDDSQSPTEKFWALEQRVREEAKILTTCLDGHTRSKLSLFMVIMYRHKMLSDDDLKEFSEELRERITQIAEL